MLNGKRVVVTGGTGSLGRVLIHRLLSGEFGRPEAVMVFSRDEAKQNAMRLDYENLREATDEIRFSDWRHTLRFSIGDVADENAVRSVLQGADIVFNAAALKQVPSCEYFPSQAVRTNIIGADHIVRVIRQHRLPVETVVGISTDKACKPVNVMGMTKAIQERIFVQANLDCGDTQFVAARYGNVLASRGSVVPLFLDQGEARWPPYDHHTGDDEVPNEPRSTLLTPSWLRYEMRGQARSTSPACRRHEWSMSRLPSSATVPSQPRSSGLGLARSCMSSWSPRRRRGEPSVAGTTT